MEKGLERDRGGRLIRGRDNTEVGHRAKMSSTELERVVEKQSVRLCG